MHRIFLFLLTLLTVSCTDKFAHRIHDGRFYSPNKEFSVKYEKSAFPSTISEHKDGDMVGVTFENVMSDSVHYEVLTNFLYGRNEHILGAFWKECVLTSISSRFQGTKILKEEKKEIEGIGPVVFGILEIPQGSNMIDVDRQIHLDSIRGYLLSFAGDQLPMISTQEYFMIDRKTEDNDKLNQQLFNKLLELRQHYRNETL